MGVALGLVAWSVGARARTPAGGDSRRHGCRDRRRAATAGRLPARDGGPGPGWPASAGQDGRSEQRRELVQRRQRPVWQPPPPGKRRSQDGGAPQRAGARRAVVPRQRLSSSWEFGASGATSPDFLGTKWRACGARRRCCLRKRRLRVKANFRAFRRVNARSRRCAAFFFDFRTPQDVGLLVCTVYARTV